MRKLNHRTLERHVHHAIAELRWWIEHDDDDPKHRTHAELVATFTNEALDEALKGRGYDGDARGGNELTSPEAWTDQYMLKDHAGNVVRDEHDRPIWISDVIADRITRLVGVIALVDDLAVDARERGGKLGIARTTRDRQAQTAVGSAQTAAGCGHCSNCNVWVPGTSTDRLKAGRCENCYRWWIDHGRSLERPRELWGKDQADLQHAVPASSATDTPCEERAS